jgi:GT2 family glycosyltransferase
LGDNLTKVGVIAPFYHAERHIAGWLKALTAQSYSNFKVYAIDDASSDQTGKLLEAGIAQAAFPAQLTLSDLNQGPSAARNFAIRQALSDGCDLILLLDCDCRVAPDWIERHVRFHEEYEEVRILGGAIQGFAKTPVGRADGFCSWFTAVPFSDTGRVSRLHLSTTNLSIKRSVFDAIGFFDESLATGEDVAFCRKAQQQGLLLWLQSDIVALHLDRNDFPSARAHHYRWGLHSYTLSLQQQGGYYEVLKRFKSGWPVACLVPVIASLNVVLILLKYSRRSPTVWLYLPWIAALKWWNAVGVYHGFLDPSRCRRELPG